MAINLPHQRLRVVIRGEEGICGAYVFRSIFSAVGHLGPFVTIRELCFSWMADILGSRYAAVQRYDPAGEEVEPA